MATKSETKKRKTTNTQPASVKKLRKSTLEVDTEGNVDTKEEVVGELVRKNRKNTSSKNESLSEAQDVRAANAIVKNGDMALQVSARPYDSDSNSSSASKEGGQYAAALLRGFETSSDSDDPDEDEMKDPGSVLPVPETTTKALSKAKSSDRAPSENDGPTVLYVGHIPHGFYEHQMRAYFSQFGDISRLRLSRNRKTGASRHYAFVEFASDEVARIVADTMDGYLMFGHILKVKIVPVEKVHENLFKGAGKRFKRIPWRSIERSRLNNADRKTWERRVSKEDERRKSKARKMKELGYLYSPPDLRNPIKALTEPNVEISREIASAQTN